MRHRPADPSETLAAETFAAETFAAETFGAIIGLILIALVMLTSPGTPAMHGAGETFAEIARFYDAR